MLEEVEPGWLAMMRGSRISGEAYIPPWALRTLARPRSAQTSTKARNAA